MPDAVTAGTPSVLVVDADAALRGLIGEWLEDDGFRVAPARSEDELPPGRFDAVVVDLPFLREPRMSVLERVAQSYPAVPVLALSSGFLPGVDASGSVARAFGVAAVLPKPVRREALVGTIASLLRASRAAAT